MKKAFSMIELVVVIGIIAILAGVLMASFGGTTDKARMARCAANMKNLAAAVGSYAMGGSYPYAQSAQYEYYAPTTYGSSPKKTFKVHKGWISWNDQDTAWPLDSIGTFSHISYANTDEKMITYAITNGAIWSAVGKQRESYICPEHLKQCRKAGVSNPGWSYQMNAYFGYEKESGQTDLIASSVKRAEYECRTDRRLLFAEIPALDISSVNKGVLDKAGISSLPTVALSGGDDDKTMDGCLLYKSKDGTESIGFNHISGNRIVGHVAFADGHVETIAAPKDGNFLELTDWLCRACDISYVDGNYTKIFDPDEDK